MGCALGRVIAKGVFLKTGDDSQNYKKQQRQYDRYKRQALYDCIDAFSILF
jgi:hypothetical protein